MSAAERREAIVVAATEEFAVAGLHGTAVDRIAARAGITQPYVFRLFGTKKELFLAVVERAFACTREIFARAAAASGPGDGVLKAMGAAYADEFLADRTMLLAQMQAYAASDDPEVRDVVRRGFRGLYEFVERASGASAEEISSFFAVGMLLNVSAALDLGAVGEPWSDALLGPCGIIGAPPSR
jgi:AcrR family transcriptional regulator